MIIIHHNMKDDDDMTTWWQNNMIFIMKDDDFMMTWWQTWLKGKTRWPLGDWGPVQDSVLEEDRCCAKRYWATSKKLKYLYISSYFKVKGEYGCRIKVSFTLYISFLWMYFKICFFDIQEWFFGFFCKKRFPQVGNFCKPFVGLVFY